MKLEQSSCGLQAFFPYGVLVSRGTYTSYFICSLICAALGLTGLAGAGAAEWSAFTVFHSLKQMGRLISQGIVHALPDGQYCKNRVWIAPCITSMITGPIAAWHIQVTNERLPPVSSMGTCGLVGPNRVYTGWVSDVTRLVCNPPSLHLIGLDLLATILHHTVVPALFMKSGTCKSGNLKL